MTCIVAVTDGTKVVMGGDSAGVDSGLGIAIVKQPKVFDSDGLLIGYTSSFRMGQILQFHLNVPKRHPDTEAHRYVVTELIPEIRTVLKDGGYTKVDSNVESGGQFLVAFLGRIFTVYDDFQVFEGTLPFAAVGCGASFALGAMKSAWDVNAVYKRHTKFDIQTIASYGLEAATELSAGVRPPFTFLTNPAPPEETA